MYVQPTPTVAIEHITQHHSYVCGVSQRPESLRQSGPDYAV